MKVLILLLIASCLFLSGFSQDQHLVDSLQLQLKKHDERNLALNIKSPNLSDTTAADILGLISAAYWGSNSDKSVEYATQVQKLSEQIGYKRGISNAYGILGVNYKNKGNYVEALVYHKKALAIREQIGHKKGVISSFTNIGNIYALLSKYTEALKYYLDGLNYAEEVHEKSSVASFYNNIGGLYIYQGDLTEALKNLMKALPIRLELGNKLELANLYDNLGGIYLDLDNFSDALKYLKLGLTIREEINDKSGMATSYSNIGSLLKKQGHYQDALPYYVQGIKWQEEIGNKQILSELYNNIGLLYIKDKKYNDASEYINKAMSLAKEIGNLSMVSRCYSSRAELDSTQGNFKEALANYRLSMITQDSFSNKENIKKMVGQQMQYDFDKKEALAQANFVRIQDSISMANEKQQLALQKEMQLKALRFEFARKQALAKSEEEKKKLRYEEELKRAQINFEFQQKALAIEAEQQRKDILSKAEQQQKEAQYKLAQLRKDEKAKQQRNILMGGFGLLSIIALFFFFQYRQNQSAKRKHDMELMKQRISRDLHDDIGSTLSTISKYAELATKKMGKESPISDILGTVNLISKEMLSRMSDIVWSINPKNDTIEHLLSRLQNFCASSLSTGDITHQFNVDDHIAHLPLNSVQLKEIYLIGKEAINNSMKYSKCKEIQLNFSKQQHHLLMEIKDDGLGFSSEQISNPLGGLGIQNMKDRAAEIMASLDILSSPNMGCSIKLRVPLT